MMHPPKIPLNTTSHATPRARDLTLDEAFADPLIRAVMRADGVDAAELREAFAPLAARLAAPRAEVAATRPLTSREWRALVEDCLCAARRAAGGSSARGRTEVL